jgi:hypothetical protein
MALGTIHVIRTHQSTTNIAGNQNMSTVKSSIRTWYQPNIYFLHVIIEGPQSGVLPHYTKI